MTEISVPDLVLDWLLKVRLVVARCGEMDCARWWNTQGQLGPRGADVLRRGFPRTHQFAQARSVFAAAANRCAEIFDNQEAITLWRLDAALEEEFDLQWEVWLDSALTWRPFFEVIASIKGDDVVGELERLGLVDEAIVAEVRALSFDAGGRALPLPLTIDSQRSRIEMLALGFGRGEPGRLVVPYARGPA